MKNARIAMRRVSFSVSTLLWLALAGCGEQSFPDEPSNGVGGGGGEAGAGALGRADARGMRGSGASDAATEKGARSEKTASALPPATNLLACSTGANCGSGFCVDGICCNTACTGTCNACTAAKKGSGADGVCGPIKFDTDPDEECLWGACSGQGTCKFYNGVPCPGGNECLSYCVDGVCCGNECTGTCQSCSAAKKGSGYDGVCGPIAAGTDPDQECAPDTCNGQGMCSQIGNCVFDTDCDTGFCTDGVCCDNACTGSCQACTAAKKGSGVDGICGPIKFDTDPDEECLSGACSGQGTCKFYNGVPCPGGNECLSYCVDGVCCGNECTGTCQSCSAAKKGSGYDGVCGPIAAGTDPDGECVGGDCNGAIDDPAQCTSISALCLSFCDNQAPDGTCSLNESTFTCSQDCACGDGLCSGSENWSNCSADCKIEDDPVGFCGNHYCEAFEVDRSLGIILCEKDCWDGTTPPGTICGNGTCSGAETSEQCPADCGNKTTYTNGDGNCETGENRFNSFDCSQNIEKGIVLESTCDGYALVETFADGNGGTETHTVTECSESCGAAPWKVIVPNFSYDDWNGTKILKPDCKTCTITDAPLPIKVIDPAYGNTWASLGTTYEMDQNPNDCDPGMSQLVYDPVYGSHWETVPLEWEKTGEKQCANNCTVYDCYGNQTPHQYGRVGLWKPAIAPWSILEPYCQ